MALVNYVSKDTDCLYTTVQNTSGKERVFGYLGERGKRLGVGELITVPGNIADILGGKTSKRKFKALERSLMNGTLKIVQTPAVHLYDPTNDETQILALDAGALGVADPCWVPKSLSSSSSSASV